MISWQPWYKYNVLVLLNGIKLAGVKTKQQKTLPEDILFLSTGILMKANFSYVKQIYYQKSNSEKIYKTNEINTEILH